MKPSTPHNSYRGINASNRKKKCSKRSRRLPTRLSRGSRRVRAEDAVSQGCVMLATLCEVERNASGHARLPRDAIHGTIGRRLVTGRRPRLRHLVERNVPAHSVEARVLPRLVQSSVHLGLLNGRCPATRSHRRGRLLDDAVAHAGMVGLGAEARDVVERVPEQTGAVEYQHHASEIEQGYIPRERGNHARPQEYHAGDRAPVVAVAHRAAAVLAQQAPRVRRIGAAHVGGLGGHDDGVGEGAREGEEAGEHGADAPGELDGLGLMPFGPEEVEEEGGAEDGGDVDADEDVVRGDADEVVVVDGGAGRVLRDEVLLVDVICGKCEEVVRM